MARAETSSTSPIPLFVMRELDGTTTDETAEALELSIDVMKTRLHRALEMLRESLLARAGLVTASLSPSATNAATAWWAL